MFVKVEQRVHGLGTLTRLCHVLRKSLSLAALCSSRDCTTTPLRTGGLDRVDTEL
jgi:hypothetical protein